MNNPSFETDRIQELKNERIQLQKKTFTKWINAFLEKGGATVKDLFEDLSDGKLLIKLLEIISGEKVGAIARGKHRIHKLENVSKALLFLQKSVKLESIGPEDVVDGKEDLILGLMWMIILRFQISDVQNEQESKDAKSAKDALLLWCQRKTKGCYITDDYDDRNEIKRRIEIAMAAVSSHSNIWKDRSNNKATKLQLLKSVVFALVTYGSKL